MKTFTGIQTLLLASVFLLYSCAPVSIGRKFDTTHAHEIQKGVHTKETIRQWFGEPYAKGAAEAELQKIGCVDGWSYLYSEATIGKSHAESLNVYFDSEGKVCAHGYGSN